MPKTPISIQVLTQLYSTAYRRLSYRFGAGGFGLSPRWALDFFAAQRDTVDFHEVSGGSTHHHMGREVRVFV